MSDLYREAERQLNKKKYKKPTKIYMFVFSILILSIYAYGYYLSWAAFEAAL